MTARVHACLECGADKGSAGDFCTFTCRSAFNNRRRLRGAEIYDLYMAHRFERATAQSLGLFQAINRLASNFRQEDVEKRAGRKSWRHPRVVMDERPYLKAVGGRIRAGR